MIQNNRIIKVNRSYWEIAYNGNIKKGIINNTYKANMMPAVGDFAITEKIDDEKVLIVDLVPRKNELIKDYDEKNFKFSKFINNGKQVVAANIDKIFVVTSLNKDFNMGKIERFLLLANLQNAETCLILSKVDICENKDEYLSQLKNRFPRLTVITTSGISGQGVDELLDVWKSGETAVFIGSSGVGKSTLVNKLYGEEIAKTGEIRARDDKGKHTTSASTLFEVVGGRFVIDTPGVREVGLSDVSEEKMSEVFAIIEQLAKQCKKYKCTHTKEDGCAVKIAVENGEIDKKILERYVKINRKKTATQKKQSDSVGKDFKAKAKIRAKKYYKRRNFDEDI